MYYPVETREKAVLLRKRGYSIKEVAKLLSIAVGTSSVWLRDIKLNSKAQERLKQKQALGQYNARLSQFKKREKQQNKRLNNVVLTLSKIEVSQELAKLCCSLIYWCEGNKSSDSYVRFTNSDPSLIKLFILLLRRGFKVDKTKFRILMHLHGYHNEQKQKIFWNKVTKIPLNQFNRTYWKFNTGKRKHNDYPGCISISYYDAEVAKQLLAIYNSFVQRGVG